MVFDNHATLVRNDEPSTVRRETMLALDSLAENLGMVAAQPGLD